MKSLSIILPVLWSASVALATIPLSSIKRVSNLPTVANKFIVEVDSLSNFIPNKRSPYASVSKPSIRLVDRELTRYSHMKSYMHH